MLLSLSGCLSAQSWSGILSPARAIDWSHAGATIQNRTVICHKLSPGATAAQISRALASCRAGEVVYLNPGAYTLTASIVTSAPNVTLRGAGPDQTFLVFTATSSNCNGYGPTAICIWSSNGTGFNYKGGNTAPWKAGYSPGTTQITLGPATNPYFPPAPIRAGTMLVLTQADDASDTGNIYACQTHGSDGTCSQQGGHGVAAAGRMQMQNVLVTAIHGSRVSISPGLYAPNWTSSKSPTAWWSDAMPLRGFGIENLSVDYSRLGDRQAGIEFFSATNCWVKNVRSINATATRGATRKHVAINQSNHITVRDSYFYGSSPTSAGYGVDFGPGSADNLAENNIFQHMASPMMNETSTGGVFGYNYAVDDYYNNGDPNWQMPSAGHHGAGDYYQLWEGDEGIGFAGDNIHGTSFFITHFRCYYSGHDPATEVGDKRQASYAYFPFAGIRYYNLLGSVLGTKSYHAKYLYSPASPTDCGSLRAAASSVIVMGFSDQAGDMFAPASGSAIQNCPSGPATTFVIYDDVSQYTGSDTGNVMLWGNYPACTGDANCNTVRWEASENASSAPVYPGLKNPSTTLPASFYLSAKPSWWESVPWPAVGPDVSGGNIPDVGGHAYHNPAANCYLNVQHGRTDGSAGPLTFNADDCYGALRSATPPSDNVAPVSH